MSVATEDEEAAVIAVIKAEHEAFWMGDRETHARCHLHSPDTWFWSYWRHGGLAIRHGWEELYERSGRAMDAFIAPSPSYAYEATWECVTVKISGVLAWVTFQQRYPAGGPITGLPGTTSIAHQLRILEKHDSEWKIALVSVMVPGLDQLSGPLMQLDGDGRIVWKSEAATKILETDDDLIVRSGRLHIRNRATDQKLQAGIAWAATVDRFLMARGGSIPIVVDAVEGEPTKLWWLIAESGLILFSFDNRQLAEDRLAMAAPVFGLSPAQLRLAKSIVEGRSLVEISEAAGTSVNTARTQLRRMFEKVGVHSQPALVRVLLSVAAPR